MAVCGRCGRDIRWGNLGDERIPLDPVAELRPPGRDVRLYRLNPDGGDGVEQIPPARNDLAGYPDHRQTCPVAVREATA